MQNDRLSAFLTDRLVGLYQIRNADMPFVPAGGLLYTENMGIPVQKENKQLQAAINSALTDMRQSGALNDIHKRWFGRGSAPAAETAAMTGRTVAAKLLKGFSITIGVAAISLALGLILAIPAGIVLNSPPSLLHHLVRLLVDFVRGTPVLIQLFFVYFGAPQMGIKLSPVTSAIITLTINASAYMAEVIRSGLMAIEPGQRAAGAALGLNRVQTFRWVVWPQAFRIAMPPLVNSSVALLKDTALISVIAVAEVIREAQSIISVTYDPMRFYFIVALMFFVFTYPLMKFAGRIERGIKQKGFVT
jgi:His/Glu/Gln/Arg/opine family amino acid ABC transporter permease subunit